MCGIFGIAGSLAGSLKDTGAPLAALRRRGPDDSGISRFPACLLAHTRLSIIDIGGGKQPMRDEERRMTVVFNGEIYNYRELRKALEERGHRFRTSSDTEVILKAFAEYGDACPEQLDGQFAFAVWAERERRLFLARDRFGEKPLYVARLGDSILFASELKALLATGLVGHEIDPVSLDNYLSLLYVPPWRSIYKNIGQLRPAHTAVWKDGTYIESRYWKLKKYAVSDKAEEAAGRVRELLTKSVRSRMIADVEVGAFLSGGMDSSIVVRLAQTESGRPLKTFSAGFEDLINELPYAEEIATLAHTDHHPRQMQTDLVRTYKDVCSYFDEPFADSSNVPTSMLSRFAREHVKVALSGDGGDELFWGYGHYTKYRSLPKLTQLRNALTFSNPLHYYKTHMLYHFTPKERARLLREPEAVEADPTSHIDLSEAGTPQEVMNLIDIYMGLPGDMLTKVDRASMMHSLEVRSPFLQHKLAEYAFNLPAAYKTDGHRSKRIFARAFGDLLPEGFFTRKKQGFNAPVATWLRRPDFRKQFEEWLEAPLFAAQFSIDPVQMLVRQFYEGDDSLKYKVWSILSFEAWLRAH